MHDDAAVAQESDRSRSALVGPWWCWTAYERLLTSELARLRLETWSVTGCRGIMFRRTGVSRVLPSHLLRQVTQAPFQIGASSLLKQGTRRSPGTGLRRGALTLLTVLAIGQLVALAHGTRQPEILTPAVAVGDDLSSVVIKDSGGETIELAAGYETLLLVFDPDCPHTTRVAESWKLWLEQAESEVYRTIAVSSGAVPTAMRYARDMHWKVRVGAVERAADGQGEHALMNRTPWVFAVRRDGTVVAEGHGIRLAEVAQAIQPTNGAD